jgi:hypothetical protein
MKSVALLLVLSLLVSCDSGDLWSDGKYVVYWLDTGQNRQLGLIIDDSSTIRRVEAEVIGVGQNEQYIVAKRLNHENGEFEYFYIDRVQDHMYLNGDEISVGPFTEIMFQKKSEELGLPGISKEFR